MTEKKQLQLLILAAILVIFVIHALSLSFTQDDAFISYRYVKNYMDGLGLVYNPGERVEGYTNFFFIIILIFFGLFRLDYIIISKILGVSCGIGTIMIAYLWSARIFERKWGTPYPAVIVAVLLLCNSAFAYWAVSGLETSVFAFLVLLGLYLFSNRNNNFVTVFALSTLVRPEGLLLFIMCLVYAFQWGKVLPRRVMRNTVIYLLLIGPHLVFRLYYYHDIFPNPFYAKTGWSIEYFVTGIDYFWGFLKHYGFGGLLILIPLALIKNLPRYMRFLLIAALIYSAYIIFVGGDVLYGDRFFMPLLPIFYMAFVFSVIGLAKKLFHDDKEKYRYAVAAVLITTGLLTYILPYGWLHRIRGFENGLIYSMSYQGNLVYEAGGRRYTVACSTIGAFGYYSEARIIDMLGLTDRTIAKNPDPVSGIETTWKERNYNVPYVMDRGPDLILFSTGMKPSAPAEKALFLSSKFRQGYYQVIQGTDTLYVIFRRKPNLAVNDTYYPNAQFVNYYTEALNLNRSNKLDEALEYIDKAIESSPPDFYLPYSVRGEIYLRSGERDKGMEDLALCLDLSDGYAVLAAHKLAILHEMAGDSAKADYYYDLVLRVNRIN